MQNWTKKIKRLQIYLGYGEPGQERLRKLDLAAKSENKTVKNWLIDLIKSQIKDF